MANWFAKSIDCDADNAIPPIINAKRHLEEGDPPYSIAMVAPNSNSIDYTSTANWDVNGLDVDMDYVMPQATIDAKIDLPKGHLRKYFNFTDFHHRFTSAPVDIEYCYTEEQANLELQKYLAEDFFAVDLEWEWDSKTGPVDLIQIASKTDITLIHVAKFPGARLLENFTKFILSNSTKMIGLSAQGDMARLRDYYGDDYDFRFKRVQEVNDLYQAVNYGSGQRQWLVSLSDLTKRYMAFPLYKDKSVLGSNWRGNLNQRQRDYAATDAWATICVFCKLVGIIQTWNRPQLVPNEHTIPCQEVLSIVLGALTGRISERDGDSILCLFLLAELFLFVLGKRALWVRGLVLFFFMVLFFFSFIAC